MTDGGNPPGSGKPWGGRFTAGADPAAEAFTSSLSFDRRLWLHDIRGSAAWARGLERAGLIDESEDRVARQPSRKPDEIRETEVRRRALQDCAQGTVPHHRHVDVEPGVP